jgi:hypothetical protein
VSHFSVHTRAIPPCSRPCHDPPSPRVAENSGVMSVVKAVNRPGPPPSVVRTPLSWDHELRPRALITHERVVCLPAYREQPIRLRGRPSSQSLPLVADLWMTIPWGALLSGPASVVGRDDAAITPGPAEIPVSPLARGVAKAAAGPSGGLSCLLPPPAGRGVA